jgi:hypothetical protein
MALAQVRSALKLLKPIAKAVPLVGESLEAAVEFVIEGCTYVQVGNHSLYCASSLSSSM